MFALFFRPSCHLVALPDFALSQKGAEQTNCVLLPTDLTSVSSSNSNQQMSMFQKSPNYSFRREVGETALSIITVQMSLLQSILMTQRGLAHLRCMAGLVVCDSYWVVFDFSS